MDLISQIPFDDLTADDKKRKTISKIIISSFLGTGVIVALLFIFQPFNSSNNPLAILPLLDKKDKEKVDDWQYQPVKEAEDRQFGRGILKSLTGTAGQTAALNSIAPMGMAESFSVSDSANIGYAVGGAKDINNFRENIKQGYLPLPTDVTYEGLFYDYFFDTGKKQECDQLFCPSYSAAVSKDPVSGQEEYYLAVGLNSNIKEKDFKRKKLNLAVVLDISGSMSSSFDQYYYDQFGRQMEVPSKEISNKTKMEVAKQSVAALLDHLTPEDRFGMVLFDDDAYLAKPMLAVGESDLNSLKKHILEIQPSGGTQMSAGMEEGVKLFSGLAEVSSDEYENRIIFLTDAMPNLGETDKNGLLGLMSKNSSAKIYSTFIGIGVDLNTELVDYITKIRGANYYSVHSEKEFATRLDEEFDYMVTPLVFNLNLSLEGSGFKIDKVYGSPEAAEATGQLMKINTLFPSKQQDGQTKGGLVLLKLSKTSADPNLQLKVSYEDRSSHQQQNVQAIVLPEASADYYDNPGLRKGILLARYANLLKNWTMDERNRPVEYPPIIDPIFPSPMLEPSVNNEEGIIVPPIMPEYKLGEWERQSVSLTVSSEYKNLFSQFKNYFVQEMSAVNDSSLNQEVEILKKLGS
ncbi:MAG: VWA domain-containing protein [Candidatus Komeilibacteria bacterium]|nr:VWA domain-containing protein [Candidatus Komeilibacteria bacterium]